MHVLCCLSVFTLPAHLCGPGSGRPGVLHQDRRIVLSRVPIRRGFSVAAPRRRGEDGAHLGHGGMLPHLGPQVRRPPREPRLLCLQKPEGMRLGLCWGPAARLLITPAGCLGRICLLPGAGTGCWTRTQPGQWVPQASEIPRRVFPAESHGRSHVPTSALCLSLALI